MRKVAIASALALSLLLAGCESAEASGGTVLRFDGAFLNITSVNARIITDNETGVQYLFVSDGYGQGGLTVLVDVDGKPMIAKDGDGR